MNSSIFKNNNIIKLRGFRGHIDIYLVFVQKLDLFLFQLATLQNDCEVIFFIVTFFQLTFWENSYLDSLALEFGPFKTIHNLSSTHERAVFESDSKHIWE